jgi:hypothetical protein
MEIINPELQRDMDLVRLLLMHHAGYDIGEQTKDYTPKQVALHGAILHDAGYVQAEVVDGGDGFPEYTRIFRLTWQGYEFLELAKDSKLWRASKEAVKKAGSWSFSILAELLKAEARKHFPELNHILPPHA